MRRRASEAERRFKPTKELDRRDGVLLARDQRNGDAEVIVRRTTKELAASEADCRRALGDDPRFLREILVAPDAEPPIVVTEHVPGGAISRRVESLDLARILVLARGLVDAVCRLHERGYAHRALRPGVVFQRADGSVAVGDLRWATRLDEPARSSAGEGAAYAAPDAGTGRAGLEAADMHAVGAIVYELLFVGRPFATERRRSARGSAEWPKLGPDDPRERFKPLVTQLLDPSPGRRPVQRDDLERLLQEIADGIRGQERTVAIQPPRRERRRTRSVVVLIAAVALAIVALVTCHERSPPGCAGAPAARLDLAGNALRAVPSDARVILTSIVTTDVRRRIQICRTASEAFYVDTAESSGAAGLARSVILHAKARTKANGPPGTVDGVWVAVHTSGATRERLVVYRRPRDGVWCLRAVRGTSVSDVCPTG